MTQSLRSRIEQAVRRGKDWLLTNQITAATPSYDVKEWNADRTAARWKDEPVPAHLFGAYYANLFRNDPWATKPGEIRRDYHNTWHTAQAGVALLEYLDFEDDPAVRNSLEMAWAFLDAHQVKDGPYRGVYVEVPPEELSDVLTMDFSHGHKSASAAHCYSCYDNIETDLLGLERFRRTGDKASLQAAIDNADFYLRRHPEIVFLEVETHNVSISGMCNDAIYGQLAELTGESRFAEAYERQIQRLSELGLDLRADNNIRNMYWDATAVLYAVRSYPKLFGPAMAKLSFLAEHTLWAQKDSGVLWFRFVRPGEPDRARSEHQDGAATYAMIRVWGEMYNQTGDGRWLTAIRRAVMYALDHQYGSEYGEGFANAFEYAGVVADGHGSEMLRDISTIFALRALLPLLAKKERWAVDFWKQGKSVSNES
ncbi:MAG TPA: hypothetical protein PK082_05300 [Phycisphaerae bacterium]|nr:hypothetical protein [Phycisphaerae bacterium]